MPAYSHHAAAAQLPLAGAVLCCTSIAPEQRAQLAAIGAHMGAAIKLDLTSDVTHLIVGSIDSAKYRYVAKSRDDVKVLSPAWLDALRSVWMAGDDHVDVEALESQFRMPTFFGLKICLTGFDNPDQRRYIQDAVESNGAEYHGDLTKSVTHLIAATPSGKKYEHALNWHMNIVSLEWLEQSLERGMALEEASFNPALPVDERGRGAWERRSATTVPGKRTRDAEASQTLNPSRRKLRRSASTRLGGQSEALWAGITAASSDRHEDGGDDWTEHSVAQHEDPRAHTPAPPTADRLMPKTAASATTRVDAPSSPSCVPVQDHAKHGIFEGRVVCPHGFDKEKTDILCHHLNSHGARVLSANELDNASVNDIKRGFLVLPHDAEVDRTGIPECAGSLMSIASNWWVERCLYGKCLVNPAQDVLSQPFGKLSVRGFSPLTVNSTGFSGIELLHVTKIVALLGATYDEHLSAKTSVIICNATGINLQKLKFAAEKRIPAVTSAWLSDCIRQSCLQSYEDYRFDPLAIPQSRLAKSASRASLHASADAVPQHDSIKTHQKNLPSDQTGLRRLPRNPGLGKSAEATSAPSHALARDESSIPHFDGHASLPLQSISANSARRHSTSPTLLESHSRPRSSSAESLIRVDPASHDAKPLGRTKQPASDSVTATNSTDNPKPLLQPQPPPAAPKEIAAADKDYSDILAQLRANRKTASTPADPSDGQRRRRRQLGRATSTRSNQSGTSSGNTNNHQISLDDDENQDDDGEESALVEEVLPSQQLGWDEPGAAKAREAMIRKLGGTIKDKSVLVQGIGVVMDEGGEGSGRTGRTRRG